MAVDVQTTIHSAFMYFFKKKLHHNAQRASLRRTKTLATFINFKCASTLLDYEKRKTAYMN